MKLKYKKYSQPKIIKISKEKRLAKQIAKPLFCYFADKIVDALTRR